ncbi:MAG: TRAP transporter large permease [Alphaproteobacteria bacterium]|nr:TRAP transporter large permease [Alphaproteobacteria bacterium]
MTGPDVIGILGTIVMLVLLMLRMPIGIAMLLVGVVGFAILNGMPAALAMLGSYPYSYAAVYDLAVIPLFVLMGNCAGVSGMGRDLYNAAYSWIGHWRGGLASATIVSCAGFAAVSGSSVASAVTMGRVCLPEMRRYDYDPRLATGTIAAGGTLGILIPPSTAFVVYGILTEQSIGRLLLAGFFPGLLLTVLFVITIMIQTRIAPQLGPPGPVASWRMRAESLGRAGPMIGIVTMTIGGMYLGVFTTSEAAAVGAFLSFAYALWRKSLGGGNLTSVLLDSVKTTAMVFLILIGAQVFGPFLALSGLPAHVAETLSDLAMPRWVVLVLILALYIVLGMFLEGFAMMVLTIPIVFPIVTALGYDPIWFGVMMVIVLEMGLISPPVGINVFVVKGLVPDVPMGQVFIGIIPFMIAMAVCLAILMVFPEIALFLPDTMIN